ncbi:efflux RND transporter permease subunit [Endozoicomonadaceae bacterium StTr2]
MIRQCLEHPRLPGTLLFFMLLGGLWGLRGMPLQLLPVPDKPLITVECFWRHAAPEEIEAEVVKPLEDVLGNMPALSRMDVAITQGDARFELLLDDQADRREVLLDLISRINRVRDLPQDLEGPYIRSGSDHDCLTWLMLHGPDTESQLLAHQYEYSRLLQERIGRLPGVARLVVHGGGEERLEVRYDPFRLAASGFRVPDLAEKLRATVNRSAGLIDMAGRFEYPLRYIGRSDRDELKQLQLAPGPVVLGDLATVKLAHEPGQPCPRYNNKPAFAIEVIRQSGSDAMQTLNAVSLVIDELNNEVFHPAGWQLDQPFNMGIYLQRVLTMLAGNLGLGIGLTLLAVCIFIRQWRAAVLIIAVIPVCLLLTLGLMRLLGFSLNIISIAGLAFAVGMVVDAAIVVTENLMQRMREGESVTLAGIKAASTMSRALLAATLTTLIVFIPGVALPGTAGHLFTELGVSLVLAVALSLLAALFLVPLLARWVLRPVKTKGSNKFIVWLARQCRFVVSSAARRRLILLTALLLPLLTLWEHPALNLLPFISRDEVQVWLDFEGHLSPDAVAKERIAPVNEFLAQLKADGEIRDSSLQLWPGGGKLIVRPVSPEGTQRLLRKMRRFFSARDDMEGLALKAPLFAPQRSEQEIRLYLKEQDLTRYFEQREVAAELIVSALPDTQIRSEPGADNLRSGLNIIPKDRALQDAGWERGDMAEVIQSLGGGLHVGDWYDGDRMLDLVLVRSPEIHSLSLNQNPVATDKQVMPLSGLVNIKEEQVADEIRRHEGHRVQLLTIEPPEGVALGTVLNRLQRDVMPQLMKSGLNAKLEGSVQRLEEGRQGLWLLLGLSLLMLAAVLWITLESKADTLRVLLVMPVCMAGGWYALRIMTEAESVDLLTLTGFVILMGLVVNNAILLLSEIRAGQDCGMQLSQAIEAGLVQRLRPMLMTTLTTVTGMLPLVLSHAGGSEIYRGLAIVVASGMLVSLPVSLLMVPAMLLLKPDPETIKVREEEGSP